VSGFQVSRDDSTLTIRPEPPFDFDRTVRFATYDSERYVADVYQDGVYSRLLDIGGELVLTQARSVGTVDEPILEIVAAEPDVSGETVEEAFGTMIRMLGADKSIVTFYEMAGRDPLLAPLIGKFYGLRISQAASVFESLVMSVLGQQISSQVARVLRTGLIDEYGISIEFKGVSYSAFPRPQDIADRGVDALRAIKFSARKAEYLVDISASIASGNLNLEALMDVPDDEAVDALVRLRGIGPWTAHWMLIRAFGRPDGFPHGDLALQNYMGQLLNDGVRMTPQDALGESERWSPYRSYVTTYLFAAAREGLLPK
jgi:DNA-3-methyladenine glycosylase II